MERCVTPHIHCSIVILCVCRALGAVAGVALISGLLVAWHVWRRKCHHNVGSEAAEEGSHMLLNEFVKVNTGDLRRKISNPDLSMAIKNIPSQVCLVFCLIMYLLDSVWFG